ncbi:hypothetical protein ACRRVD_00280 [Candidatus Cardinium hertigii]|uniref:hypothetical protein n=1 Tax=Candidatus Cardinium hertigii TaxID=247481 RepID=UPI003D7C7F99
MPQNTKQELIERLLTDDKIVSSSQGEYVKVSNPKNPQGFSESLALLLSKVPTIHSPLKPEFFVHFFLGSALTLPYSKLMDELSIKDIYFKLDNQQSSSCLKLVFNIEENINGKINRKIKFVIINTAPKSKNTDNIQFTAEEIQEVYHKLSLNKDNHKIDGQILNIFT